jgi:hypothetical protein
LPRAQPESELLLPTNGIKNPAMEKLGLLFNRIATG